MLRGHAGASATDLKNHDAHVLKYVYLFSSYFSFNHDFCSYLVLSIKHRIQYSPKKVKNLIKFPTLSGNYLIGLCSADKHLFPTSPLSEYIWLPAPILLWCSTPSSRAPWRYSWQSRSIWRVSSSSSIGTEPREFKSPEIKYFLTNVVVF